MHTFHTTGAYIQEFELGGGVSVWVAADNLQGPYRVSSYRHWSSGRNTTKLPVQVGVVETETTRHLLTVRLHRLGDSETGKGTLNMHGLNLVSRPGKFPETERYALFKCMDESGNLYDKELVLYTEEESYREYARTKILHQAWVDNTCENGKAFPIPLDKSKLWKPVIARLELENPELYRLWWFLHNKKVSQKYSNNQALTGLLTAVTGDPYDYLVRSLTSAAKASFEPVVVENWRGSETPIARFARECDIPGRGIIECLPTTATLKNSKAKQKAWHLANSNRAKAEGLGIDGAKYPLLLKAVEEGNVPLGIFHAPGKQAELINVEFDLWERALGRPNWRKPLYEIVKLAAARVKFSKRVTSYFSFLFEIEEYLNKHAPRPAKNKKRRQSWVAIPKPVTSEWELEMAEATEEGTTKRRSAMTPVADNDAGTVSVPYVSMRLSGYQATWAYAEKFFVAREGKEDLLYHPGGCYPSDLAVKLNGRDDYGLCYYTLTGSPSNTGYPTFLIIFERTTLHGTRVHFHRVHPSRSRGPEKTPTPPAFQIQECYRYMAGNIKAEEIAYQQGDLLLVKTDKPGKAESPVPVRGFENHEFVGLKIGDKQAPVMFAKSTAAKPGNVLGWLFAETGMRMPHPEHEPVEGIEPGWYVLRRAKSWEANPTAVMTLNID